MFSDCLKNTIAMGLFLAAPVFCRAEAPALMKFTSRQGAYTVDLPEMPHLKTEKTEDYRSQMVSAAGDPVTYSIVCLEPSHGWKGNNPHETIKAVRDVQHRGFGVKIQDDREISLGKDRVPGRAYLVSRVDEFGINEDIFLREQMFLKGKRMYALSARCANVKAPLDSPSVNRFFSSFAITDPAPAEPMMQSIKSEDGRFTVLMPGKPSSQTTNVNGKQANNYSVTSESVTFRVQVTALDLATVEDEDPRHVLKGFRSKMKANMMRAERKMRHEHNDREVSLGPNKIPGLSYQVDVRKMPGRSSSDQSYLRERMYLDGQLIFIVSAEIADDEEALNCDTVAQFFSSFDITRP